MPDLINHISWTLSFQQVQHYFQLVKSGKFRKFDYHSKNKRIYGTEEPPEYDLSKITASLYIYRSTEDSLSSQKVRNSLF